MKKLVKESLITEKFTEEESDPIEDMGIGGLTFSTLKRGAIISPTVPRLSLKYSKDGYFTYPGKGMDLPEGYLILVTSVRDYVIPGTKEIKIYYVDGINNEEETLKAREKLKKEEPLSYFGHSNRMLINQKKFDRMFKVIERGFSE